MGRSGGLEVWRLDTVPLITVGDTEADPLREVVGITITPRHVVIAQESTGTLRFYDRRGSLDNVVGGRGEGPAMGLPEHLPPYGWLSLGYPDRPPVTVADGLVWALRYGGFPREGADPEGPEWFVFRPGAGQIATLSSPDDVVLVDVAGDLAAVLRRTELDEEIVELRRIMGR